MCLRGLSRGYKEVKGVLTWPAAAGSLQLGTRASGLEKEAGAHLITAGESRRALHQEREETELQAEPNQLWTLREFN